jgi:hypothetical protein
MKSMLFKILIFLSFYFIDTKHELLIIILKKNKEAFSPYYTYIMIILAKKIHDRKLR